jgi:hypothetical protein
MAQANVIVTYAPARRAASAADVPQSARRGQRRWSATLAGAVLAGGAVFALGQFVTSDGNFREAGFPVRAGPPIAELDGAEARPPAPAALRPETKPRALPYLALVRDIAPGPATQRAARPPSAAVDRGGSTALIPAPAATPEQPTADGAALLADLTTQPLPPVQGGLRRDLAGFLEAQGHELMVPDSPGTLIATHGALPPAPVLAASPAKADIPLETEAGPIEVVETPAEAALAVAPPPELSPPPDAAPPQRLAEVAPAPKSAPTPAPTAMLAGTAETGARDEAPASLALAPLRQPMAIAAPSAQAPVQSYPLAVVNGEPLGAVTLRDNGASEPAIHLGALLELVRLRMPEAEFTRLSAAAAADRFVTFDELRAAGIMVRFDPRENRLVVGVR